MSLYADRAVFLTISYVAQFVYSFLGAIVLGVGAALRLGGFGAVEPARGCRAAGSSNPPNK